MHRRSRTPAALQRDHEGSQVVVPEAFVRVHAPTGRLPAGFSRHELAARHELCEDLATLLAEQASTISWRDGLAPDVVLERIGRGLAGPQAPVSAAEAHWVLQRLAELLDWPAPPGRDEAGGDAPVAQ